MLHYRPFTLGDRRQLFQLLDARQPVSMIAAALGKHRSSIYREIKRNHFSGDCRESCGYFPVTAEDRKRDRRQKECKLRLRADLRDHVIERLRAGCSPQQIAGRLEQSGNEMGRLCHETIYRFHLWADWPQAGAFPLRCQSAETPEPKIWPKTPP